MKKVVASVLMAIAVASVAAPASAQLLNFGGLLQINMNQGGGINVALLNGNANLTLVSGGIQP